MKQHHWLERLSDKMLCPISAQVFLKPVVIPECGHSVEADELAKWFQQHSNCPLCRTETKKKVVLNFQLKDFITELLQLFPELYEKQYFSPKYFKKLVDDGSVNEAIAMLNGHPEFLNAPILNRQTVVHMAVLGGKLEFLRALVQAFPKLNLNDVLDEEGDWYLATPLSIAAAHPLCNADMIKLLIDHGADPSLVKPNDSTPLLDTIFSHKKDCTQVLLESKKILSIGKIIKSGKLAGYNAVLAAVVENLDDKLFNLLLRRYKKIDSINHKHPISGDSALHIAVARGYVGKVKSLLAIPEIDVEVKNKLGLSPLEIAERANHKEMINLLTAPEHIPKLILSHFAKNNLIAVCNLLVKLYKPNSFANFKAILNDIKKNYAGQYKKLCDKLFFLLIETAIKYDDAELILELLNQNTSNLTKEISGEKNIFQLTVELGKHKLLELLLNKFTPELTELCEVPSPLLLKLNPKNTNLTSLTILFKHPKLDLLAMHNGKTWLELGMRSDNVEFANFCKYVCLLRTLLDKKNIQTDFDLISLKTFTPEIKDAALFYLQLIRYNVNELNPLVDFIDDLCRANTSNPVHNFFRDTTTEAISKLNLLFDYANHGFLKPKVKMFAKQIRDKAFEEFKESLANLNLDDKIKKLHWAKNQKIFTHHRNFFSWGRTHTVIEIDKMLANLQQDNQSVLNAKLKTSGNSHG